MQVKNIPLSEITNSEMNPRKSFDQESLEELAQNIKENGLVQPITVRPIKNNESFKYEIVCGERRFRAATLIGMKEIQAIVKDLDDKKAFAAMIIENLQRKDIDPMEEAAAFSKLHNDGAISISQISKMMGKSTSFVLGRIQLNNTIDEFVSLMKNGPLVLTHLLDICKLTKEQQTILYNNCFTESCIARWTYKFPNIPQLHEMIDEHVMNYLDKAVFSLTDTTLNDNIACESCPLNTKNNPDSFKDVNKPRCMKRECFTKKSKAHIFRIAKESGLPLVYQGDYVESEEILNEAENYGLKVLNIGNRNYVIAPVEPKKEDFTDNEFYQTRYASYKKVKAVFDDNIKDGTVSKVFEICFNGRLSGVVKYAFSIPTKEEENVSNDEYINAQITKIKTDIQNCKEKQQSETVESMRAFIEGSEYSKINTEVSKVESDVFSLLILKRLPFSFKNSLGLNTNDGNQCFKSDIDIVRRNKNAIMREYIRTVLSEKSVNYSNDLSSLLGDILKDRFGDKLDEIQKEKKEKYKLIKTGLKNKIASLKEKE